MNQKQILGFLRTIEEGSISKAAQNLYLSPQALLQQINALESEVGVPLIERSPQGVRKTPAGDFFYHNLKHILNHLDQTIEETRRLGKQPREMIRVGVFSTPLFLPSFCFTFSRKFPSVEIRQIEIDSANFYKLLLIDEIDILETGPFSFLEGTGLDFIKLMDLQPVCILAKSHPFADREFLEPADLIGQMVGVPDTSLFIKNDAYQHVFEKIHLINHVFGREQMAKICLDGGMYIIPEPAALSLRPFISIPFKSTFLEIGLLSKSHPSPIISKFIQEAIDSYRSPDGY
jgi:DNA-binding transcriptional LysR family regulator